MEKVLLPRALTLLLAHLRRLVCALVIRSPECIIVKHVTCKVSIFELVVVAEKTGLSFTWSETPKTGFLSR